MRISKTKALRSIRLSECKMLNYSQSYDSYLKSQYSQDKLLNSSLKHNNNPISLISYFNLLFNQTPKTSGYIEKRLLIITSPPFGGVDIIITHMTETYPTYQVYASAITKDINDALDRVFAFYSTDIERKATYVLIKDYPLRLSDVSINYKRDFYKFKSIIQYHLNNKDKSNLIFVLYWTDCSENLYFLEKFLGKNIVQHEYSEIIDIKKISVMKLKGIIKAICSEMHCLISREQIDKIAHESKGNLVKLKQTLYDYIKHKIERGTSNEEDANANDLFHLLGKLLYNKRIDPIDNQIKPMKKHQLLADPKPELYFTHQEIIDAIPTDLEQFNYLLIEHSYDHFVDINELAEATDCFSYTNTFNKFEYVMKESNIEDVHTVPYMKMLLNTMAVTTFNLSQYNKGSQPFKVYKKSRYNFKKTLDEDMYFQCISYNSSVAMFDRKKFEIQVGYAYRRLTNWFINQYKSSNNNNSNENSYSNGNDNHRDKWNNYENKGLEEIVGKYKRESIFRENYTENVGNDIINKNEQRRQIIDKSYHSEIANIFDHLEGNNSDIQCEIDESDEDVC